MGLAYFRDLLVDISDNLSNGASELHAVGGNKDDYVPFAVMCPSNLQSTTHVKFQVAYNAGLVDADYHDVYVNGAIATMAMTVDAIIGVPEAVATMCAGAAQVRAVTCTSAGVGADPSADITLRVLFGSVMDVKTSGIVVAAAGAASTVQGNVASGATNSGNPVLAGGVFESAPAAVTNGQRRNLVTNPIGALLVAFDTPGTSGADGAATLAGAITRSASAVGGSNPLAVGRFSLNGSGTWDRDRNNAAATLLASGARTLIQTSADIPTYNFKALTVILDVTVAGSGNITVTINGKDPASGKYYLLLSGAAVSSNSTNIYSVGPGIAAAANVSVSAFLPAVIQIVVTHNNGNTITYSVGTNLMI